MLRHQELTELMLEARDFFETDQSQALLCIERALQLMQAPPRERRSPSSPGPRGGLAAWQLRRVKDYIVANLGARIVTRELAARANLSIGHFFRAFRISVGVPPQFYVMCERIRRAEELMLTTSESLAQIALEIGLSDQAHFSRAFRRLVGVSPSCWRRKYGQAGNLAPVAPEARPEAGVLKATPAA
jgi:transcriptional regulator GlxA family with amidase domain